jgi:hypothetical protein
VQYIQLWDMIKAVVLTERKPEYLKTLYGGTLLAATSPSTRLIDCSSWPNSFRLRQTDIEIKGSNEVQFFIWLAVHKHCLSANNLALRGWPHRRLTRTALTCLFMPFYAVWCQVRIWSRADFPILSEAFQSTEDWWIWARKRVPKNLCHDFDTNSILVHWGIWKQRKARFFQQEVSMVDRIFELITKDIRSWRAAGCVIAF